MRTNLKKKALLPLVAMVLVSVISLSSVTYAWFSMSTTAVVSGLDVQVNAADGIQISLDADSWSSLLDLTAIKNANISTNNVPAGPVNPVSTIGEIGNDGFMKMFYGERTANDTLNVTEDTTNFLAFDLYFKMGADTTIALDHQGTSVTENDMISVATVDSKYCSRVAFVYYGSDEDVGAVKADKTADSVTIWEPEAGADYYGLKDIGTDLGISGNNGAVTAEDKAEIVDTVSKEEVKFDLGAGVSKIRVYIWMEGQDAQCTNDASGGAFSTTLKFTQVDA